MLTGDDARTAAAIAQALGMDHRAELMPEDKVAAIREMAAHGCVMMVGDGINDAPALATAHVGMAMGSGGDAAIETADAALLRNRAADFGGDDPACAGGHGEHPPERGDRARPQGRVPRHDRAGPDRPLACDPRRYRGHGAGHAQCLASAVLRSGQGDVIAAFGCSMIWAK